MTLKHDIRPIIIHVLIPWNKVTLYCQIVPMCVRVCFLINTLNTIFPQLSVLQSSPLVRSVFCPMKIDHTIGLTLHPWTI